MTVAFSDAHVLAADVTLVRVRDLRKSVRAMLECEDDAFAVSRPSGRAGTKLLGAVAGELLGAFVEPRSIADVVDGAGASADGARAFLERMITAGFLVEAGSAREAPPRPMFMRGDRVGEWTVVTCLHFLDDVDVYQVRGRRDRVAALKIARAGASTVNRLIRREAAMLRSLRGGAAPQLLATGSLDGRSWFASDWCDGVDAETAATDIRALPAAERHRQMHALIAGIAEAYAALHVRGIVHGDAHAKNIRVSAGGTIRLLDFGWSRRLGARFAHERLPRVGAGFLFEPEYAAASLAHRRLPPATVRGEQYILATLLDKLWTGKPAFDFSVRVDEAWRQIAEDEPLSFAERRVPSAPEVERALRRAMSKRPAERFASMAHFARALQLGDWATGRLGDHGGTNRPIAQSPNNPTFGRTSDAIIEKLGLTGAGLRDAVTRAPTGSLAAGAAGVAYALRRIALARDNASPLAWADVWCARAESEMALEHGLAADQPGLSPEEIGPISLLHAAPGVHFTRALVSDALGRHREAGRAVRAFARAAASHSPKFDLTHGRAGTLLGCAQLIESTAAGAASRRLRAFGEETCRALWRSLAREPRVGDPASRIDLGAAHGWSGVLFATLRWCQATGTRVPRGATARLTELAACADPFGRGLRWHLFSRGAPDLPRGRYVAGWCNGAAGLAMLWFLAGEVLDDADARRLGVGSAWHAWESDVDSGPFLCCGFAGRAYAMLAAWRSTGDDAWLGKARALCRRALDAARKSEQPVEETRPESLYFGDLGLALLAAELAVPSRARMPLLERRI
jgi:serine/threonine-protein kinase